MNALCTLLLVFPRHSSGLVWTVYASIELRGRRAVAASGRAHVVSARTGRLRADPRPHARAFRARRTGPPARARRGGGERSLQHQAHALVAEQLDALGCDGWSQDVLVERFLSRGVGGADGGRGAQREAAQGGRLAVPGRRRERDGPGRAVQVVPVDRPYSRNAASVATRSSYFAATSKPRLS